MGNLSNVSVSAQTNSKKVEAEKEKNYSHLLAKGIASVAFATTASTLAIEGTNSIFNKIEERLHNKDIKAYWAERQKLANEYVANKTEANLEKFNNIVKTKTYDEMMNKAKNKYLPTLLKANKITKIIVGTTAALFGAFGGCGLYEMAFEK